MNDPSATCAAIQTASSQAEVIAAVRDFISSLRDSEAALVPPTLVAVGVDHAKEIAQAAVELAQRETAAVLNTPEAKVLKAVGAVLSTAAMRMATLSFV